MSSKIPARTLNMNTLPLTVDMFWQINFSFVETSSLSQTTSEVWQTFSGEKSIKVCQWFLSKLDGLFSKRSRKKSDNICDFKSVMANFSSLKSRQSPPNHNFVGRFCTLDYPFVHDRHKSWCPVRCLPYVSF